MLVGSRERASSEACFGSGDVDGVDDVDDVDDVDVVDDGDDVGIKLLLMLGELRKFLESSAAPLPCGIFFFC